MLESVRGNNSGNSLAMVQSGRDGECDETALCLKGKIDSEFDDDGRQVTVNT